MAKSDIEIEIQVAVEHIKPLLNFLEAKAKFTGEKHQVDEYFSLTSPSFLDVRPVIEWLRLRNEGGKASVNYKHWHHDGPGNAAYCDEYESGVDDPRAIRQIFASLNFKQIVVVDKLRRTWHYQDYEIAVDRVKNLGDFVEIEHKGKSTSEDARRIADEMKQFLHDLGCGKTTENTGGYAFQLLPKK
ncbi:class IV adenylate cyclase [Candidatus Saccharibacteria bacterium]|nr:class IV adenylate cyclase [Candidatus Saccharibacteria bacterium]